MQFPGKLNEAEFQETLRLLRPKGYAWRMALSNFRLVVYAVIAVAILWASVAQHRQIPPAVIATRLLLLVAIGGFTFIGITREAVRP